MTRQKRKTKFEEKALVVINETSCFTGEYMHTIQGYVLNTRV